MSLSLSDSYLPHDSTIFLPGYSEVPPTEDKGYGTEYSDPSDSSARLPTEGVLNGMDPPELGYPLYDSVTESAGQ